MSHQRRQRYQALDATQTLSQCEEFDALQEAASTGEVTRRASDWMGGVVYTRAPGGVGSGAYFNVAPAVALRVA